MLRYSFGCQLLNFELSAEVVLDIGQWKWENGRMCWLWRIDNFQCVAYRQSEEHSTHFRVHTTQYKCSLIFSISKNTLKCFSSSRTNIVTISVSVPLTPLSTFMGRWVFGEALCKLLPASQVTMSMMTMMTMVMVMTLMTMVVVVVVVVVVMVVV